MLDTTEICALFLRHVLVFIERLLLTKKHTEMSFSDFDELVGYVN